MPQQTGLSKVQNHVPLKRRQDGPTIFSSAFYGEGIVSVKNSSLVAQLGI